MLVAWCACGTQRAIRHGDKTPGTQAGSRLRAKPAPEGPGLDAAGVEGSLGAMPKGEWQERHEPPSKSVNIAPSNRVTTLSISHRTLNTHRSIAASYPGGAQIVVGDARKSRRVAAGLLRYHWPLSRPRKGRYMPSAGQRTGNGRRCQDMKRDCDEVPQTIRHGGSLPCHAFPGAWVLDPVATGVMIPMPAVCR